jgi:hypothetical protein
MRTTTAGCSSTSHPESCRSQLAWSGSSEPAGMTTYLQGGGADSTGGI